MNESVQSASSPGRRLLNAAQDHPIRVDLALVVAVLLHAASTWRWSRADILVGLKHVDTATVVALHLGVTSLAAILAGFSGVIVVFALGAQGPRFEQLRADGGESLQRNWVWLALSALLAAFLGLLGAVATALGVPITRWSLELAVLLCGHAAARQLWLLGALAGVTQKDDAQKRQQARTRSASDIISGAASRRAAGTRAGDTPS